jgi:8-oxo-dGTP diphosphatase
MQHDADADFLAAYDPSSFAKPSVAVDIVLIGIQAGSLRTVLVRRTGPPQAAAWALPGGFVRLDESLDAAAERVLSAKAGLKNVFLEQLYTFGKPDRDPRMRIISVAYYALVDHTVLDALPTTEDASLVTIRSASSKRGRSSIRLVHENGQPIKTAFDHGEIITAALERLRGKINYAPLGFALLPDEFTLLDLQNVHEIILDRRLNKDSFRRKMLATGDLVQTGRLQDDVDHRPAALYRRTSLKELP